jgi:heat shock protein HslJ
MKEVLAALAFAISAIQAAASVPPDLTGPEWVLTGIQGKPVEGERPPTILFTMEHAPKSGGANMSGYSGCNRFFGAYAILPGGAITMKVRGMTKMACEPGRMALEREFQAALDAAAFYEWRYDKTLTVENRSGTQRLDFQQSPVKRD